MKKTICGMILILAVIGGVIFSVSKQTETPLDVNIQNGQASSGQITPGMKLGSYHEIRTQDVKVTIGDKSETGSMKPKVELSKWDNEVNFKISYPATGTPAVTEDNKIVWQQKDKDIYFKTTLAKDAKPNEEKSDKFEFDILLKEKSTSNVFTYNIDTQNLDFLYQPPLTEKEKTEGYSRPENVVGSYAVYYKDGKTGDFSKMGGKDYKTGKAFHIYRPLITDANGKTTWGVLHVIPSSPVIARSETTKQSQSQQNQIATSPSAPRNDNSQGTLTVTVDPTWLASAAYPVTVDPTFGYTTAGASSVTIKNTIRGSYFAIPENGTPTGISTYIYTYQSCFTGDTLVTMVDGSYKKIKDIQLGEKVQSYNEKTKEIVSDTVVKLFHHPKEEMGKYYLTIETDDGKKVEVTPNHRVYLLGKWVHAGVLKIGDRLLNDKNREINIIRISKVFEQVPVYNLEIKNNHVYFANFLVHNAKASFTSGTQVDMADGSSRNIEKVSVGDKVLSYNLDKKQTETSIVSGVYSQEHDGYLIITDIYGDELKVTDNHPIYTDGKWQLAKQIKVGDSVRTDFGDIEIKAIKQVTEKITAYNINVPGNHNYFANGKLVSDETNIAQSGDIASGCDILTVAGAKKVEDLIIGEKVITLNPSTKTTETGNITSLQIGIDPQPILIINNTLSLTGQTGIYTKNGEKKVNKLVIGDELIKSDGTSIGIFSISQGSPQYTYAISVSGNHNLFVNNFLVHNQTGYGKTAIYKQSDNTQVTTSAENAFTEADYSSTTAWRTFTISSSPELVASTNYWLYAWASGLDSINLYYDSSGNGVNKAVTYGAWPDPLTGTTTDNNKYSIYTTYTPSGTYKTTLKGKMNLRGKMQL